MRLVSIVDHWTPLILKEVIEIVHGLINISAIVLEIGLYNYIEHLCLFYLIKMAFIKIGYNWQI